MEDHMKSQHFINTNYVTTVTVTSVTNTMVTELTKQGNRGDILLNYLSNEEWFIFLLICYFVTVKLPY